MNWLLFVYNLASALMLMLFLSHLRATFSRKKADNIIKIARREGRVVEAVYSHYFGHGGDDFSSRGDQRGCVYRYVYQGQEYKVKLFFRTPAPETIDLIIYKNPKKAKSLESAAKPSVVWKINVFIICFIILYIFFFSSFM